MLLRWVLIAFGLEHFERIDQFLARLLRTDHRVDVTPFGGDIRAGKAIAEFLNLFIARLGDDFCLFFLGFG